MSAATTTAAGWSAAIISALREHFLAECPLIGAYSFRDAGGATHPVLRGQHAILLRAGDSEIPGKQRVIDRQAVAIDWVISVAVPTDTADADTVLLDRAVRVATLIASSRDNMERGNRWGLASAVGDSEPPVLPEWDDIDIHGYLIRPVRWRQVGYFARSTAPIT